MPAAQFQIHARLAKYNADDHTFEAVATDQTIDKVKERMHYDSSKAHFIKWSQEFEKATDGKSVGNLRSMHGKVAAGCLKSMVCDDEQKAIIVRGLIVDPVDQKKMEAGVYTGVSIGGSCLRKWDDEENKGVMWYEAEPSEVSLVDNPCNPSARFKMAKADGSEVEVELTGDPDKVAIDRLAKLLDDGAIAPAELVKFIETRKSDMEALAKTTKRDVLKAAMSNPNITMGDLEKLAEQWLPEDQRKGDVPALLAALFKVGEFTPEELADIEKREFTQEQRDAAADKGQAMPDGSYPIKSKDDLKNAIQSIGRAKNPAAVKRHIKRRAKALGESDMIPEDWGKLEEKLDLTKGLENLGWLARITQEVICLADCCEYEAMMEGDGSIVPGRLNAVAAELGEILCEMAEEETQEEANKATVRGDLQKGLDSFGIVKLEKATQGVSTVPVSFDLAKAIGMANASESDLAKAFELLKEKASKWDKLPVRKGVFRAITKGEDTTHREDAEGDQQYPADVVAKVRAAKSGDLQAHIWLAHKGMADYATNPAFEKIK